MELEFLFRVTGFFVGLVTRWAARMRGETVPDPSTRISVAPVVADFLPDPDHRDAGSNTGLPEAVVPNVLRGGQPQVRPLPARLTGWRDVAVGVTVLLAIAAYLAIDSADMDPNDPGAADVAFFVSPIIAIGAAIVTGVLLVRVSARGLIGIGLGRARRARRLGPIIAPVAYLAFLIAIASPLDAADSGTAVSIMSFIVPTVMGIGLTLAAAVVGRPSRASGTDR